MSFIIIMFLLFTKDFMEVFSVFHPIASFLMRSAQFQDDGAIHTYGILLGAEEMKIHIDFDESQVDTTGDGEPDTIGWFQKTEHFEDTAPLVGWSMVQNFGFRRLDNGTCEVYHQGESFEGFVPIRFLFQLHARYVIWATERYVNSEAFGSEELEDVAEEARQNIPYFVLQEFVSNLTKDIEAVKENTDQSDKQGHEELQVTLQRLQTISSKLTKRQTTTQAGEEEDAEDEQPLARLHTTVRTRKRSSSANNRTNTIHQVELKIEDPETKAAIRRAMTQIDGNKKATAKSTSRLSTRKKSTLVRSPASELATLHRRTTKVNMDMNMDSSPHQQQGEQ